MSVCLGVVYVIASGLVLDRLEQMPRCPGLLRDLFDLRLPSFFGNSAPLLTFKAFVLRVYLSQSRALDDNFGGPVRELDLEADSLSMAAMT